MRTMEERRSAVKKGLSQLNREQLRRIIRHVGRMLLDGDIIQRNSIGKVFK